MRNRYRLLSLTAVVALVLVALGAIEHPAAEPSFFTSDCAGCHSDDNPTCAGCHEHRGSIYAFSDQSVYGPGETVTVTLARTGGRAGWIRGLLYDHNNIEVDRASGPTGTGDDGGPEQVTFPVTLQAPAPMAAGQYVWNAAWYGNNNGNGHIEYPRPVTIVVESNAGAPGENPLASAARQLAIFPNPLTERSTLRFRLEDPTGPASLAIFDAGGRLVRQLTQGPLGPGEHVLVWDGTDERGAQVMTGTYLAVLSAGTGQTSRPVLVLR